MRIVQVVHGFPPEQIGGTELYTYYLSRELAKKHEVFIFSTERDLQKEQFSQRGNRMAGFYITRIVNNVNEGDLIKEAKNVELEEKFKKFLHDCQPEVVHFQHLVNLSASLIDVACELSIPIVMTLQEYWFTCFRELLLKVDGVVCSGKESIVECLRCIIGSTFLNAECQMSFLTPFDQVSPALRESVDAVMKGDFSPIKGLYSEKEIELLELQLFSLRQHMLGRLKRVDRIIAPSRFLMKLFINSGIRKTQIDLCRYGIDAVPFSQHRREKKSKGLKFGYIGNFNKHKGIHILVEAFRILSDKQSQLIIYGDSLDEVYKEKVKRLAAGSSVVFKGLYKNKDIAKILTQLDAVIVPSIWYENYPFVVQEAFAAGVPIIASRLGGLNECVRHGRNGFLFEPGNPVDLARHIGRLIETPQLIQKLKKGVPKVKTIQQNAKEMTRVYHEIRALRKKRSIKIGQEDADYQYRLACLTEEARELSKIPPLEQKVTELESAVDKTQQEISYKEGEILELVKDKEALTKRQEEELKRQEAERGELEQKTALLEGKIDEKQQEIVELVKDKEALTKYQEEELSKWKEERNGLEQELSELRQKMQLAPTLLRLGKGIFKIVFLPFSLPLISLLGFLLYLEKFIWKLSSPIAKKHKPDRPEPVTHVSAISIVIPNWNGKELLGKCLDSIYQAHGFRNGENEVLVVDDASTDDSAPYIRSHFPRVRLIRNKKNMGFGHTCNRGVSQAKNQIIVLINNDVIVSENFLSPLLKHFRDKDIFAVSPKLYGWDKKTFVWGMHMGRIENGYIRMWNEAETRNPGQIYQTSPSLFAIGGAMVFRKKDFLWLGGFDEIYRPNSWEDIDISYRAWKRGLKVLYEPDSFIYHKGAATVDYARHKEIKNEILFMWKNMTDQNIIKSHLFMFPYNLYRGGKDVMRGFLWALRYLPKTMLHRYKERRFIVHADKRIFDSSMVYYRNFMRNNYKHRDVKKKNILIIAAFMPYPLNVGGRIRIYTLAKLLASKGYHTSLLTLIDDEGQVKYIPELKKVFREVHTVVSRSSPENRILGTMHPKRYRNSFSLELINKLLEMQKNKPLDLIQIESNELLYLVDFVKHVPVVYVEHDTSLLNFRNSYYRREKDLLSEFLDYLKRLKFHLKMIQRVDKIIFLSREDRKVLETFLPRADIALIQTGVDLEHFPFDYKKNESKRLIFVGHYLHYPNEDAVIHFSKQILPLIKKQIDDVELLVVGSNPTERIKELSHQMNIKIIGTVEDVEPFIKQAAVYIVPIRLGSGIKGKVLEAMACGVPVVSTRQGAYGIEARPEHEILIAGSPQDFARQTVRLLQDENLCFKIAHQARRLVEEKYDWQKIAAELDATYQETIYNGKLGKGQSKGNSVLEQIANKVGVLVERKTDISEGQKDGLPNGPQELHLELTYRCNSRCIMCDLWDYYERFPDLANKELTFDEIKRFVEESRYLRNVKTVILSGGEPFLREDITDICGFFSRHLPQSSIGILTNAEATGLISKRLREIMDKFQPKSLWIGTSLDGVGQGHNRIRGNERSFDSLQQTIRLCRKQFPEIAVCANFTLTPYNTDQLIPAYEFAEREGLNFSAQFVVPKQARERFIWTESQLLDVEKDVRIIIEKLLNDKDPKTFLSSMDNQPDAGLLAQLYYWSHLAEYQRNPKRFFKRCPAASRFAMFTPQGDLFLCPILKDQHIGNIREKSFDELWGSPEAREVRKFISNGNCHCWLVCIVMPLVGEALTKRKRRNMLPKIIRRWKN